MTIKTIEIDEMLYKELLKRKKEDESISDVIEHLLEKGKDFPVSKKNEILEHKLLQKKKEIEGYNVFNPRTWLRIVNFLRTVLNRCWQDILDFPDPEVYIDPSDGSYDIHWDVDNFELLLVIPENINELVHVSGEKKGSPEFEIEARINFEFITEWILDWLRKIH